MILKSNEYKPLARLLDNVPFNTYFARSVLEGHVDGQVFVNDKENPTSMYVCHKYGMSFLYGDADNAEFNGEISKHFNNKWLQAWPRDWDDFLSKIDGVQIDTRLNFAFNKEIFEQNNGSLDLDAYGVEEASLDVMKSFKGNVVPANFWKDSTMHMCKAYVAVDEAPVSIAYSSYIHGDVLELGIETHEEHRGKGLALAVCVAIIRYCIKNDLTPDWSCRLSNAG
ncbi:MAG: GNAT family N-acetyltransferase, partial [Defluviitaleaceae bacterium]|nr:GNAT family N-acetyltransferase [Defluviitaleaceae bacterium]